MTDISHVMGSDLTLGPTGDLAAVGGSALGTQRVLRRLLTNPGDYIWQPGYGGGLGQMVGQTSDAAAIQGIIRTQMFREAAVQQDPAPTVTISGQPDGETFAEVQYTDADTGEPAVLTVPLS